MVNEMMEVVNENMDSDSKGRILKNIPEEDNENSNLIEM